MTLSETLKTLSVDRLDNEQTVELMAGAAGLRVTYQSFSLPEPSWLIAAGEVLAADLKRRRTDMLRSRKAELEAKKAALRSREEQREAIEKELAELNGKLD